MNSENLNIDVLLELISCADNKATETDIIDAVLEAYLSKLNCFMTGIIKRNNKELKDTKTLPANYKNDSDWNYLKNIIKKSFDNNDVEFSDIELKNNHYYIYSLSDYGYLVLGRKVAFENKFKNEFRFVVNFFGKIILQTIEEEHRKESEIRLAEERHLLRTIIDNIPVNIYAKDLNYKKTLANVSEIRQLGLSSETEVLGKTDFELYNNSIGNNTLKEDKQILLEGKTILGVEKPMGNDKWALISKLPLKNNKNEITGMVGISIDYTERRKVKEQLMLFQNLFDNLSDCVKIFQENGQLLYVNKVAGEHLDIDPKEVLKFNIKSFTEIFWTNNNWKDLIDTLRINEKLVLEGYNIFKKSGTKIAVEVTFNYITVNEKAYIVSNTHDITERKKAEINNKENEVRLEQIALQSRTFAWEIDLDGVYTYVSPIIKTVLGYDPDELVGKVFFYNLQAIDQRESFKKRAFEQMNRKELIQNSVNLHYDKNGNPIWLSTNCFPMLQPDGSLRGYRGSDTDVTERVINEKKILESEQLQRSLIENISVGIIIIDKNSKIIEDVNTFAADIIQSSVDKIVGNLYNKYLSKYKRSLFNKDEYDNSTLQFDDVILTEKGVEIPVIKTFKKVIIKGIEKILLSFVDISDRKETELKLRDSEDRKSSLIESMNDVVFVLDHDMCFIEYHKPDNIKQSLFSEIEIGKQFESVGLPDEALRIIGEALCNCMESGKITKAEFSIEDADKLKWFEINITILKNNSGLEDGLTCVVRDITDQKESYETIRQQIKLQELLINISTKFINIDLNNVQSVINQSLKDIGTFVGADRSYIFNYDFKNNVTYNTFEWCDEGISFELDKLEKYPLDTFDVWINDHKDGKAFYLRNTNELTDENLEKLGQISEIIKLKSIIAIPLKYNEELMGFVGFDSIYKQHRYNFKEKQLLELFAQMIVNVEIRKRGVEMLTYQEEKYRNIISNMSLGLVELDINDQIIFVNNQFCEMIELNKRNLIGKYAGQLLLPMQKASMLKYKNNFSQVSHYPSLELEVKDRRGKQKWWLVNGAPHYNDKKELVGSVGVFWDISNQKKLNAELIEAKQIAENAAKAKESFLTNMSHEIRTPLNVIIGMVRELGKEKLSNTQRVLVNHSEASAFHLLTIVNNILDMSKIEAGEFLLDLTDFSLSAVFSDVNSILFSKAKSKKLNFKVEGDGEIQKALIGDSIRLRQVLINLLTNSIKFTDEGKVSLTAKLIETNEKWQKIRFEIDDTGIGMSDEFQVRLFEKFTQEQDKANRDFEGTGLGMSISKQLVELMGGTIAVKSKKGEGTRLWFEIEFLIGNEKKLSNIDKENKLINQNGVKVLLVEDNEMNRFIARQSLKQVNCEITEAINGLEAIECCKNDSFDIILMDIQMPKMDGVEATNFIRKDLNCKTPIIALTANAFKHDIDLYLSNGMNDFLIKPYKEEDLYKKIESNILSNQNNIQVCENIPTESSIESDNEKLYNLDQLIIIGNNDETFVNKMVEIFIRLAEETIEQVNKSFEINDIDQIRKSAHKIKPSIDNLEIISLHDKIRELELFKENERNLDELNTLISNINMVLKNVITSLKELFFSKVEID
ncbi:MAG: PAS domain S-box protein [Paludibacter sp.]|nr:PAS domain S-box protein [Paludibacter sp.]